MRGYSAHWPHSCQALGAGAAHEAHQKRFGLIAHRVACGDAVSAARARDAEQEAITNLARRLFDATTRRLRRRAHVGFVNGHGQAQTLGQSPHELRVGVRIRAAQLVVEMRDVRPAMRAITPRAVQAIARAAEHLAADQDALDELAKELLDAARVEKTDGADQTSDAIAAYRVALLRAQPAGLQRRMLREAIRRALANEDRRGEITAKHIAAIESLLAERASGKCTRLPGRLEVWREYDAIIFKPIADAAGEAADAGYALEFSATRSRIEAGGMVLMIERGLPADQYPLLIERARQLKQERGRDWMMAVLDDDALPATLIVRPRPRGARARVAGHGQTIKLKKLMIAHTIPASRRAAWPVVMTRDDHYVWSPGLPPAVDFAARSETRHLAIVRAQNR